MPALNGDIPVERGSFLRRRRAMAQGTSWRLGTPVNVGPERPGVFIWFTLWLPPANWAFHWLSAFMLVGLETDLGREGGANVPRPPVGPFSGPVRKPLWPTWQSALPCASMAGG